MRTWTELLKGKKERAEFILEFVQNSLAFQIRSNRTARQWSQNQLAQKARIQQSNVSLYENPDYGKFTLRTLMRLAEVFDCALQVKMIPFSEAIKSLNSVSHEDLVVESFDEDKINIERISATASNMTGRIKQEHAASATCLLYYATAAQSLTPEGNVHYEHPRENKGKVTSVTARGTIAAT